LNPATTRESSSCSSIALSASYTLTPALFHSYCYDLFVQDLATSDIPQKYGRPVDIHMLVSRGGVLIFSLSVVHRDSLGISDRNFNDIVR